MHEERLKDTFFKKRVVCNMQFESHLITRNISPQKRGLVFKYERLSKHIVSISETVLLTINTVIHALWFAQLRSMFAKYSLGLI